MQDGIKAYGKALRLEPGLQDAWSNLATAHKEVQLQSDAGKLLVTPPGRAMDTWAVDDWAAMCHDASRA